MAANDDEPFDVMPVPKSPGLGIVSRRIGAFLLNVVDSSIPAAMQNGNPDIHRRARIVLSFTLILIPLGLETMLFFMWALDRPDALRIQVALLAGMFFTLTIPMAFRRTLSVELGINLVLTASFIVVVAVLTVVGGIAGPLFHWSAIFPMLAGLMGARRSAWVWLAICFMTMGFFIIADAAGWNFTGAVRDFWGPALWLQRGIDVGSWTLILLAVALLYESHQKRQTVQLAANNTELHSEIQQRRRAEAHTEFLAFYHEQTSLPNRRLFSKPVDSAMEQASRADRMIAVLFLDLDGFKQVNDVYGHGVGDQLLQQSAERLRKWLRVSDSITKNLNDDAVVSRLGGDEFTILLVGLRSYLEADIVGRRILKSMEEPFILEDQKVFISASIGIALSDDGQCGAEELLRNADLAMYQAKNAGKSNVKFFEESMNTDVIERTALINDLRKGLEKGELELHYQPIVKAGTKELVGVECLCRWQHPVKGLIHPQQFIDIAIESGLIVKLGSWVVITACRQYQQWCEQNLAPSRFAISVSSAQFRDGATVETIKKALQEYAIDPSCLEIEVTQGAASSDEEEVHVCLWALKSLGVKVALSDFGASSTSLNYVKKFPADSLKIGSVFVNEIETDIENQAITMAIIVLAHKLGIKIVAEGVENIAQERFLKEQGCDEMQGCLFSRPLPTSEMGKVLANWQIEHE